MTDYDSRWEEGRDHLGDPTDDYADELHGSESSHPYSPNMPSVDPTNSEQNAFVQDWLNAWAAVHATAKNFAKFHNIPEDHFLAKQDEEASASRIDGIVDEIQGTYSEADHRRRADAASPSTLSLIQLNTTANALKNLMQTLMDEEAPVYLIQDLNTAYALVNSIMSHHYDREDS